MQWPQSVSAKRLLWGFSFCFVDSWLKVYFFYHPYDDWLIFLKRLI